MNIFKSVNQIEKSKNEKKEMKKANEKREKKTNKANLNQDQAEKSIQNEMKLTSEKIDKSLNQNKSLLFPDRKEKPKTREEKFRSNIKCVKDNAEVETKPFIVDLNKTKQLQNAHNNENSSCNKDILTDVRVKEKTQKIETKSITVKFQEKNINELAKHTNDSKELAVKPLHYVNGSAFTRKSLLKENEINSEKKSNDFDKLVSEQVSAGKEAEFKKTEGSTFSASVTSSVIVSIVSPRISNTMVISKNSELHPSKDSLLSANEKVSNEF